MSGGPTLVGRGMSLHNLNNSYMKRHILKPLPNISFNLWCTDNTCSVAMVKKLHPRGVDPGRDVDPRK